MRILGRRKKGRGNELNRWFCLLKQQTCRSEIGYKIKLVELDLKTTNKSTSEAVRRLQRKKDSSLEAKGSLEILHLECLHRQNWSGEAIKRAWLEVTNVRKDIAFAISWTQKLVVDEMPSNMGGLLNREKIRIGWVWYEWLHLHHLLGI